MQFLWGIGNGTFRDGGTVLAHASQAIALAVQDVNGDGRPDLLIGHGNDHCCYQFAQVSVLTSQIRRTTKTTLTATANPARVNQPGTFTATESGRFAGKTSGTVAFTHGNTVLGTVPVVNGKAALAHTFSKATTFTVTARFSGRSNNTLSTSACGKW